MISNDLCVYCLKPFDLNDLDLQMEKEHVFPKSWYTSSDWEKTKSIIVPAHHKCNQKYQQIEDELRIRLALITVPGVEGLDSIRERALRAIDPNCGRNAKDRKSREKLRKRILSDAITNVKYDSRKGFIPNYHTQIEHGDNCSAMLIRSESLWNFIEKLIRGITFYEDGLYIDTNWEIDCAVLHERNQDSLNIQKLLNGFEHESTNQAPGLIVERHVTEHDHRMAMFKIEIWKHFIFRACVLPKDIIKDY